MTERRFLHPLPALKPSEAHKYACSESNLLRGFTVEEDHAIVLCERDIEHRLIPSSDFNELLMRLQEKGY